MAVGNGWINLRLSHICSDDGRLGTARYPFRGSGALWPAGRLSAGPARDPGGLVLLTRSQLQQRVRADLAGLDLVEELFAARRAEAAADDET